MAEYIGQDKNKTVDSVGAEVDSMMAMATVQRRLHERNWYDNNLFDDGFHFRYVNRTTGRVVEQQDPISSGMPQRAIPKASRQLRGIANLLLAPKYTPVIYPKRVKKSQFMVNINGQMVLDDVAYEAAQKEANEVAKKQGAWIEEEWKAQLIKAKLTLMLLLAGKNAVSYLKIYPDAETETIKTSVRDAFDLYLIGSLDDIEASPFVIEATPTLISAIKANPIFDKEQLDKISPDNKFASSEIKEAYMKSKYGSGQVQDDAATLILKEAFIKVRLSNDNIEDVMQKTKDPDILAGKKMGQTVMRHVFCAGGVYLLEEYLDLQEYPFVPYTYEPGPLYQKPIMNNFIPANKSLDVIVSRLEKYMNTMTVGVYQKAKGENFQITNNGGAQVVEYETRPLEQMQLAGVPPAVFELINFFESTIEEQGASASALNQLPSGVKSGVAIESVKATEYANLEIPSEQLRNCIETITRKMLYIADNYYMQPKESSTAKNEYFDVLGQRGIEARQKLDMQVPSDVVPLSKDLKVRIEVESGLGFTMEGKKQTMQQIITFMETLIQQGMLTQPAVKAVVQKFLEVYQYGSTAEFMEAMDQGTTTAPLNEEQITQMKVAVIEALKDAQIVGPQADQKLVDSTKVGTVEALKDVGMLDKQPQQGQAKGPSESISFKDLPDSGKQQLAAKAGIVLDPAELEQQRMDQQKIQSSMKGPNATS